MIRDDADFLPVDYDRVIQNTKKSKGLNLNNIIDFLKEQGVNESTIHLVETQCSSKGSETTDTCDEPSSVQNAKEKQSSSGCTDESQPIQESDAFILCQLNMKHAHSVITNGCQDTHPAAVFLYCSLLFFTLLYISAQQKTRRTEVLRAILRLDTKLSCDNKSIFRLYYSMIVATRPDSTVRPPSRYRSGVLRRFFRVFPSFSYHLHPKIQCIFLVLNYFVIILLSQLLCSMLNKNKFRIAYTLDPPIT